MVVPNLTLIYDRKKQATKTNPAVVELKIHAGKVRKYISTGVKLLPKEWKNGAVTGREDMVSLNRQLQSIVKKCSEIITQMMEEDDVNIDAIPHLLKDRLRQKKTFLEYAHECAARRMKGLRNGTCKKYKVVFDFLDSWRGLVYFSDITEGNIRKMDEYLEDRGLKESSRYNYHKTVKCFVIMAFNEGLIKSNPYHKIKIKRGDDVGLHRCLTPAEFHRFETCKINSEHLSRARDLFVFQTYTCMSYSDLAAFDYKQCIKINGQTVYKSSRIKTDKPFTFVLLRPAMQILRKYNYKLPIISNAKYNDYLKSAVLYAKIDKDVTSHWARHTGATMLLNEGRIDFGTISKIIGDTLRETERTYAKMMDETIIDKMISYQTKKLERTGK